MLEDVLGAVARNSRRTTRGSAVVTEHINIVLGGGGEEDSLPKTALKFVAGLTAGNVLCCSTTCPMRDHANIISKHYATPYLTRDLDMTAHCAHHEPFFIQKRPNIITSAVRSAGKRHPNCSHEQHRSDRRSHFLRCHSPALVLGSLSRSGWGLHKQSSH